MKIDWGKLKTEYVTTTVSQRELAKKYNVQPTMIARKCKEEDWVGEREAFVRKTSARCVQRTQDQKVDAAARLHRSAEKLLEKIDQLMELDDVLAPRDLKSISGTMLDVKTVLGIKDEEAKDTSNEIKVTFVEAPWDQ